MTKKPKYHPSIYHFIERRPAAVVQSTEKLPNEFPPHKFPMTANRTSIQPVKYLTYEDLIDGLATMPINFRIFLDTCFITSHEIPQEVWNHIVTKQICITTGVWKELQPWVNDARCNRWFRDYLVAAWQSEQANIGNPLVLFVDAKDLLTDMHNVAKYYMLLLWIRKSWILSHIDQFVEAEQRKPTDNELQTLGQMYSGSRGWKLAQKAVRDREQVRRTVDEGIVVNAVFHSILFGRPTIVFTRDNDVFEQFGKLLYLVDTHYHSMMMAEKLQANPSRFGKHAVKSTEHTLYVGEGNELIEPFDDLAEFRSKVLDAVQCSCAVLSTATEPLTYSERTFGIGLDMQRILLMKAKTRGRNTDLFGSMNFHIQLDPRKVMFGVSGAALVNDRLLIINGTASNDFEVAINDCELAIFTNEKFDKEVYQFEGSNKD